MCALEAVALVAAVPYALATLFLAAQGLHSLWLLVLFRRHRHDQLPAAAVADTTPDVLVQLPVFNERDVVARLVAAVGALDWPRAHLRVQLLDDSTDDSLAIGARAIAALQLAGIEAVQLRRGERRGYKAGALEHGLEVDARHARGPAPFVAIFDADFVPGPDFLRRALPPLLADADVAFVQGRWEHLNASASLLTSAQAMGIDGHFAVEQAGRAWSGLALNFNGTCGVWRRAAIAASGGWQHDTLTEDLDLSYRAQLGGWKARYLLDLAVPGELPPTLEAWRAQQSRWATGSLQTARKLLPDVWRSRWPVRRKIAATLHLLHYLVHPAILASLLLAPLVAPLMARLPGAAMLLGGGLMLAGLLPPILLYVTSQFALGRPLRCLLRLPALMSFGTGVAVANTRAALRAMSPHELGFVRTPKHGDGPGSYRASPATGLPELAVAGWGMLGLVNTWFGGARWIAPLLALYVVGFLLQGATLLLHRVRDLLAEDPRPMRPWWPLLPLGAVALLATAAIPTADGTWRQQPWTFAGLGLLLGVSYLGALHLVRSRRGSPASLLWVAAVGIGLQWIATGLPLADDVNRYAVEGAQILAGQNPYSVPPIDAADAAGASLTSEVNHAEMTSIYPPLMLWAHSAAMAAWPAVQSFRLLSLLGTGALALAVIGLLVATRRPPALVLAVLWNPALVLFSTGGAHHDVLMAAALIAALAAIELRRARTGVLLASAAALLKPFAAPALPLLLLATSLRHAWIPVAAALVAYVPFAAAGSGLASSLVTFGGSMHFHGALEPPLRLLLSCCVPEAAVAAAVRVVLALGFLGGMYWLHRRTLCEPLASRVARGVALLLLCLPTLHPWYFTVLVALLPFTPSRVLATWTAAAPIYWLHGVAMPEGTPWAEWPLATALAHLPFVAWMLAEAFGPLRVADDAPTPAGVLRHA